MRICFVGDVVGSVGRRAFKTVMPGFLKSNQIDCCIVNAENSVNGLGASINILKEAVSPACLPDANFFMQFGFLR